VDGNKLSVVVSFLFTLINFINKCILYLNLHLNQLPHLLHVNTFIERSWSFLGRIFKLRSYLMCIFTEWGVYNVTHVCPTNNLPKNDFRQPFWSYSYKISNLRLHRNKMKIYCHVYWWLKTGFRLLIRFISYLQVITTINYYIVTDFHTTKHSTLISSVCLH
jgi:hypothetical protein